ncbi:hypothetical protein Tco_0392717 [Tanacetum coccineum]
MLMRGSLRCRCDDEMRRRGALALADSVHHPYYRYLCRDVFKLRHYTFVYGELHMMVESREPSTSYATTLPPPIVLPLPEASYGLDVELMHRYVTALEESCAFATGPDYDDVDPDREIGYEITDVWEDPDEIIEEISATDVAELGQRMIDFVTTVRQDTDEIYRRLEDAHDDRLLMSGQLNLLRRDRRSHARMARLMKSEARASREAWVQSMDASDMTRSEVRALRTTILAQLRWQHYRVSSSTLLEIQTNFDLPGKGGRS